MSFLGRICKITILVCITLNANELHIPAPFSEQDMVYTSGTQIIKILWKRMHTNMVKHYDDMAYTKQFGEKWLAQT